MKKLLLLFLILFLTSCTHDPFSNNYNFTYTTSIYNVSLNFSNVTSNFAKGDAILIESRINNKDPIESVKYYKAAIRETDSKEEQAILYETIASISNNRFYYLKSYFIWKSLNNDFRANIDKNLLLNQEIDYKYLNYELKSPYYATKKGTTEITLGQSSFTINHSDILVSQTDRVTRDWLSSQLQDPQSNNILSVFSEGYDIDNIGWHEGGRIKQYQQINFTYITATSTIVRKINNVWYAPNENGTFMFEVPIDKIEYPTTRFLKEDLALIIDTHGVNMLVEQSIKNNATIVIGCCDSIGKIKASYYLNQKGIKVICNTDKYAYLLLGQTNLTLTSAPFIIDNDSIVFGDRELSFNISENIIVLNSTENYGLSYYSTPTLYFSYLKDHTTLPFNLTYVTVTDYNQMNELTENNPKIIAARVYNENDYNVLKSWLEESKEHKLILFHSEPYPYGYLIFQEFPNQTTFGDLMPSLD